MEALGEDALRALVTRYAHLRAEYGEDIGSPELLQPTGKHFPDPFTRDPSSVARLLKRMIGYAPLADDLAVALRFREQEGESGGSCGTGGCGTAGAKGGSQLRNNTVTELDDGYIVEVDVADVGNGVLLTTSLARSVGTMVLMEAGEEYDPRELGTLSELAAVATGFGLLLAGGAYVYGKSCGGVRVHQATRLGLEELVLALALFLREHDLKPSMARSHLETTQREAFDAALEWVDSNPEIIVALKNNPRVLAEGIFTIAPVRGLLGRFLAKRRADEPSVKPVAAKARARTVEEEKRLAEMRALVEDALGEG